MSLFIEWLLFKIKTIWEDYRPIFITLFVVFYLFWVAVTITYKILDVQDSYNEIVQQKDFFHNLVNSLSFATVVLPILTIIIFLVGRRLRSLYLDYKDYAKNTNKRKNDEKLKNFEKLKNEDTIYSDNEEFDNEDSVSGIEKDEVTPEDESISSMAVKAYRKGYSRAINSYLSENKSDGKYIIAIRNNTAQGGSASSIILDREASNKNSFYAGSKIRIDSGKGAGQIRRITIYIGVTKVAVVDKNWKTIPDRTSIFTILSNDDYVDFNDNANNEDDDSVINPNAALRVSHIDKGHFSDRRNSGLDFVDAPPGIDSIPDDKIVIDPQKIIDEAIQTEVVNRILVNATIVNQTLDRNTSNTILDINNVISDLKEIDIEIYGPENPNEYNPTNQDQVLLTKNELSLDIENNSEDIIIPGAINPEDLTRSNNE